MTRQNKEEPKDIKTFELVKKYYEENLDSLGTKKYHYLSRMYLWTLDNKYLVLLKKEKANFLGKNGKNINEKLAEILNNKGAKTYKFKELRQAFIKKYPKLRRYNMILFRYLFAQSVHNIDLEKYIKNLINTEELVSIKDQLYKDRKALYGLSTFAINYLYNLRDYLGLNDDPKFINPQYLYQVGKDYINTKENKSLILYFFTHCIIGESRFYQKKITKDRTAYLQMLKECEKIVESNFENISLDNKLEFLVCTALLNTKTHLRRKIMDEANLSISEKGDYIIDKYNGNRKADAEHDNIKKSEHRNVLYLMSSMPFQNGVKYE